MEHSLIAIREISLQRGHRTEDTEEMEDAEVFKSVDYGSAELHPRRPIGEF